MLTANDGLRHLYKCTTAGNSAASQGVLYPGAAGEAITDGTAVFTEQTAALDAGTAIVEPSGGNYSRVAVTSSLANWAGTQGSGTSVASSGTSGQTSNNNAIAFGAPSAAWGQVGGFCLFDASTNGNPLLYGILDAVKNINNGDPAPQFNAASLIYTEDN